MNSKINIKTKNVYRSISNLIAFCVISMVMFAGIHTPVVGQTVQYEQPTWKFGLVGAANANFYQGTTQQLTDGMMSAQPFGHGNGFGLFGGLTIEYHRPETLLGFMLQGGYDSRRGSWDQVMSPCDCPLDLSTELSYLTIEPSIRVAPFKSNFYLFGGPRFAFLLNKSFEYNREVNPDFPNSSTPENVKDDFSSMENSQISMQIGTGWDIPISSSSNRTQYMISPFISYHPYMGQEPRSIETWNITTLRAGVAVKFGRGKRIESPARAVAPVAIAPMPVVNFTIDSPVNTTVAVSFIESFPLRNYVFFDQGTTAIPARYIKLNSAQATNFSEEQLGRFNQITAVGRSDRQMTVYYNILNITGERLQSNPSASITLVGSSEMGTQQGRQMSESVKSYLVSTFGITPSRITTQGQGLQATQAGGTDHELLRQENNRVAIESSSAVMMKEYQTGPDAPLGSVALTSVAPLDSYVTINAEGAARGLKSWKLEVRDENDRMKSFGPYTNDQVSLSGKSILGDRTRGSYKFTLIGETQDGRTVTKQAQAQVVQWVTPVVQHGNRYSVIYEFDKSTAIASYEKYLLEVVTPAISSGATVRIQGYSDTIGDADYNQRLSLARAENVRSIIQNGLNKAGRTDVKFDVKGHGAGISEAQFRNTLPEQRYYNRTVLIDIIPAR